MQRLINYLIKFTSTPNFMATIPNRLPKTQVGIRRSFRSVQIEDANASNLDVGELDIEGTSRYKVRSEDELAKVELLCLQTLNDNHTAKRFYRLDFAALFKGLRDQLEVWPMFFHSKDESGIEMQQGFVTLWGNFLIAETLLASISIQPLVTVPDVVHGWRLKVYGYIWMISVVCDFGGIAITALFLGYLLGCPNKASWYWMCEIGWTRNIPSILVLLDASLSLVAIAYTCWILYGYQIGIVSLVAEAFLVATMFKLAAVLGKAGEKIKNLQ